MLLPSLRRKSRPANIADSDATANASFLAGEAWPVQIDGPKPVLTTQINRRPRSSWYSQGSVSYPGSVNYTNPHAQPPVPVQFSTSTPLTPTALLSLDKAALRVASEEREDDEVPQSPGGTVVSTLNPCMSRDSHTAVSEYLRERAWLPTTPMLYHTAPAPTSTPPSVPSLGASIYRRLSSSSNQEGPLSRRGLGRESVKSKRTSITTLPYQVSIHEHEYEKLPPPSHLVLPQPPNYNPSSAQTRTASSKSFPLRTFSITRSRTRTNTNPTSPSASTPATKASIGIPYSHTKRGPSPIPITTLPTFYHQTPTKSVTNAALNRGLSQRYGPRPAPSQTQSSSQSQSVPYPSTAYRTEAVPKCFDSLSTSPQSRATALPMYRSQVQAHTQAQTLLFPNANRRRPLPTRTRDPTQSSDEGSWLYIGTLRGPTPSGVRMMDEIMSKSLEKKGTSEKGVKEIRKLLRHESRTSIEWVEGYLRARWGAEL